MAVQKVIKCFCLLLVIEAACAFFNPDKHKSRTFDYEGDISPRLLLSEYINSGRIQQARELSLVTGLEPNVTSYSGYFTVDEECGSNMFFWFFPSQNDWENDAVTIWLNGGPGVSGFDGVLNEHGPLALTMDGKLELREYTWNLNSSMIYIDSPVGVGYSYTEKDCYATDQVQVGQNLLTALQQFFVMFPELQDNSFFITGESYAGKYVPALAYAIHTSENASNIRANLKGLAIGNGWVDPINQMDYSTYLYQLGLVDANRRDWMAREEETCRVLIEQGLYLDALLLRNFDVIQLFGYYAGFDRYYNILYNVETSSNITAFVTIPEVREALHVGNATWHDVMSMTVFTYLQEDFMKSIRPWLEELVEHYRVVHFTGQLDIVAPYTSTTNYLEKMKWSGAEEYQTAQRYNWYVDDELVGYSKTVKNFTEVLIRNAGHMVAVYQPKWGYEVLKQLIFDLPYK